MSDSKSNGRQAHFSGFLHHVFIGGIVLVGDDTIKDGIFDAAFEGPYLGAGGEAEGAHNLIAIDWGLEVAYAVALLKVFELHAHKAEVVEESLLAHLVL